VVSSADLQKDPEAGILEAWERNSSPWIDAVREHRIESRRLVTDRAILEAVLSRKPETVLDIGCGEGWLVRALTAEAIHAKGVDAIPELIESARTAGGSFELLSYQDLTSERHDLAANVVVCNFALFGHRSVERLFAAMTALLHPAGTLIVQTLHPLVACGELPYRDGWREGSWAGTPGSFANPPPWYFRTLESWVNLFERYFLRLQELREPVHPDTGRPISVIFVAQAGA
jgi:2-polyprenyl-3-methyl-5-hydroxy-6-metoxy-1,4-benzoquinol methylase